jgi:hypothetical protein
MEEIDLTIPLTSGEIEKTFDKSKNYVIVDNGNENRFDYCKITDVSPTKHIHFLCKKTLSNIGTRSTPAGSKQINLTLTRMDYNDAKKDHEYKVNDPEIYKIYVSDDAMGGRRRKSRKSKKSKRSKKSRKSRK